MKKKIKARLNELTYRQYMALVYIVSKLDIEGEHAQKRGIKEVIGFDSDRMLQITLEALERKGFITFHGLDRNPLAEITEETEKNLSILSDRLLLSDEYVEYNDIKKQTLPITETKNHFKVTAPSFIDNDSLGYLNNSKRMVHRWSDFLEDYPPSLVWDKINEYGVTSANTVLDPFMGSGTTLVTAKLRNINAIGIDVNPVANFVTEVKTTWGVDLKKFKTEANAVISSLIEASPILDDVRMTTESLKNMDTMELHQWLKPRTQNDVAFTRERINEVEDERIKKLLLLALIVASRDASNVSFCPGTSFYPFRERPTFLDAFKNKCKEIYEDLLILAKINKN